MAPGLKRPASKTLHRSSRAIVAADVDNNSSSHNGTVCCFCQQQPAAVSVRTREALHRKTRTTTTVTKSYCLLHYYTTPAVRVPNDDSNKNVIITNPDEHERQLPAIQKLFSEAFVQLQQELNETAARASTQKKQDPLSVLHHIHKKAQRRKAPPSAMTTAAQQQKKQATEGGFLREVAAPERLVRTQQQQARKQQAMMRRMERAAAAETTTSELSPLDAHRRPDISKRRKSSRKSIWNSIMDNERPDGSSAVDDNDDDEGDGGGTTTAASIIAAAEMHSGAVCSSCGSDRVRTLASHSARDVRKGEIWGGASGRDEVSMRVECLGCGKMWNEQE